MAYNALNNLIDAYIYANGVQAITGQILNGVLKQMVSQLGSGYHLMGVAGPETEPASNDYAMAYFAATAGEYTDFGGITLAAGEVAVLLTSGNGSWSKQTIYNIPTGTADLENTAEFITNAVTDLVNYYTKTEIDTTLADYPTLEDLATALAEYYTKTEIDTILADYTTNTALASALADYYNKNDIDGLLSVVNAALADRYTKSETDTALADYYKKTETYDKDEVDSIVATLSRQEYIVAWDGSSAPDVTAIPAGVAVTYSGTTYTGTLAASASTVNKIYMVWNGTAYDMYGTSQDGGYSWVPMGTTTVDLSQYATKAEVSQLEAKVDNNIFGEYHPLWELGNITISSSGWSYSNSNSRVRLKQGTSIHLFQGDEIRLLDHEHARMYLGWQKTDGTYGSQGWLQTDFIAFEEGQYTILLSGVPEETESSADALSAKIQLVSNHTYSTLIADNKRAIMETSGEYRYKIFHKSGVEHSSVADLYPIDYKANTIISGRISEGTAVCTGESVRVFLLDSNGTALGNKSIVIGQDFTFQITQDASFVSFYLYKITKVGTFDVEINYKTLKGLRNEVSTLQNGVASLEKQINGNESYSFNVASVEHSSLSDLHPIAYKANTLIKGTLSQGSAVCDGSSVAVCLYDSENTQIARKSITIGAEFEFSGAKDADYISFYIYKVTTYGTFDVLLNYDGIGQDIKDLQKDFGSVAESFPFYYDSMLATKVPSIRDAMLGAGKNGSTFVFITDVHWPNNEKHSPALIGYLLRQLPILDVFYGGDTFNGGVEETQVGYLEDFGKRMHLATSRFFSINGNHDNNYNDGGTGFPGDYFYTLLLKYADYLVIPGEYDNYYFDNQTTKTRFIVLNTGNGGDYNYSAQATWLSEVLSIMPSGYHAIILLHIAYMTAADLANNTMAGVMAAAASVADTFNAQNDGRKVEAFFAGHLHDDANKVTTGGIPIILTDCDTKQTQSGNSQTAGTTGEQAFDVITVDYSGKITCVRIGRGNDRTITY